MLITYLQVERQVLRIFGIYTHAQLDQRFWASMGYQLARKGKEYQKRSVQRMDAVRPLLSHASYRCKFRNRPVVEGDYVVAPASWPEPVDQTELELVSDNQPLRPEDLDELHSLLVCVPLDLALTSELTIQIQIGEIRDVLAGKRQ